MRSSDRPASLSRRALPAVALAGLSGFILTQLDRPASNAIGTRTTGIKHGVTPTTANGSGANGPGQQLGTTIPATPACSGATVTGPAVDTRWGPVQVTAILRADGAPCSADAPVTPSDRNRSIEINQQAVPMIDQEIPAQGVNFDSISGATVTSDGYRQSLQALLDGQRG